MKWMILAMFLLVAFAGCTNSPQGQAACTDGSAAFNGTGSNSCSTKVTCGPTGTLDVGANIGSGSVTITVNNPNQAYRETFNGPGQAFDDESLVGSPGAWTLKVTTSSDFTGQYGVDLNC